MNLLPRYLGAGLCALLWSQTLHHFIPEGQWTLGTWLSLFIGAFFCGYLWDKFCNFVLGVER